ncbi:glycosyltransferase family 2 protein [Candidatus Saccharibacteria bacterium]|nr:glycosyltransferase family 2 protein [Candidatus Saccharibacteria bacterium]
MQFPLISIIIPVYNVKDYLPACLDSIKNQTYKNLEIVIVDDGSTDGSFNFLRAYKSLDKRARIIKKKNGGLSSARNVGLEHAKGKYFFFLDADDYLEKDAIEYLYKLVEKTNSPISVCSHYERRINKKNQEELKNFNKDNYKTQKLSIEIALKRMLNEEGFMLSAWGKLYARNLFFSHNKSDKIRFPENKLHEDVGTTYKLFLRAKKLDKNTTVAFGSRPKYVYNIRNSSITNQGFNNKKLELITQTDKMCDDIVKVFPKLKNTTDLRRIHARFSILRQIMQKTHKTENDKMLENSLIYFIKEHNSWVFHNPDSKKRDKLALISLYCGKTAFKVSWNLYSKFLK